MREIVGNLWAYWGKPNYVILITTNAIVRKDVHLVMGRGCAREAMQRILGLAEYLGRGVLKNGNKMQMYREGKSKVLMTFPTKNAWWEKADLKLIAKSAVRLKEVAEKNPHKTFVLPRPGCGNGGLKWADVKNLVQIQQLPNNVLIISREK
jgi:hypothetical protein